MQEKLSYILEFRSKYFEELSFHSLGQVDRIMVLLRKMDELLSETLDYRLDFHSMLMSMDAKKFCFQVDMELSLPEQLILGDSMEQAQQLKWLSQGHDLLLSFLSSRDESYMWESQWNDFMSHNPPWNNLLYRPPQWNRLQDIHDEFWNLTGDFTPEMDSSQWENALEINIKKLDQALEESSGED